MNKAAVAAQAETVSLLPSAQGLLRRKCACGSHTVAGGECAECARKKDVLQRKLTIGASNDPLEQEADRVADQVMGAPVHSAASGVPPRIQRYAGQATGDTETAPASVDRVLASSGSPLEPVLRQDMEQRFGHDFSQVRVHTGDAAEQSARDVSARAYTVRQNVVFGANQFAPKSLEGRRLLAHELTHTIQQNNYISRETNGQDADASRSADFGVSGSYDGDSRDVEMPVSPPRSGEAGVDIEQDRDESSSASSGPTVATAKITLETGNSGASPLNNLVHQSVCVDRPGRSKRCFSFAAVGIQAPQFSTTWLGWSSWVAGALMQGQVYDPAPVSGATIVNTHTPTVAQANNWVNYMDTSRLGLQDGYSVARHNCRTYSQWEFRDVPLHY